MFCAPDDLLLQLRAQVIEIVAVSGHPHNQVLVFFRMFLGIPQGIGRDHIELDMVSIHPEIAADQLGHLSNASLILKKSGVNF